MAERKASIHRNTAETEVFLSLNLDGTGCHEINTGCGFLDHMLTLLASHSRMDLTVRCTGDLHVDAHHTTEDIGICLGKAFREALGDARGICRDADRILPMDEALILCAVDLSGRGLLRCDLSIPAPRVGDFDTELTQEFWEAMVREAGMTLHLRQLAGVNSHHIIEGCFKAVAHTLRDAVALDRDFPEDIPSTKGVLS